MTSSPTIDPGAGVSGAVEAIVGGVNDNLVEVSAVGGGLIALGLIWKLVRKFTKP